MIFSNYNYSDNTDDTDKKVVSMVSTTNTNSIIRFFPSSTTTPIKKVVKKVIGGGVIYGGVISGGVISGTGGGVSVSSDESGCDNTSISSCCSVSGMVEGLSPEQLVAFDKFVAKENLFITGAGGTGKTHLIRKMKYYCGNTKRKYQITALTGCATLLLGEGAKTIHSWSGLGIMKGAIETIVKNVISNKKSLRNWKVIETLIIDEVSMMSKYMLEILDRVGRFIRDTTRPFGGIQVIALGDFFQLPPVSKEGDEPDKGAFCFETEDWTIMFPPENHIELKTMFRQTDPIFIRILEEVRRGNITTETATLLQSYKGRAFQPTNEKPIIPTKIFPTRARVDIHNRDMYSRLTGEEHVFEIVKRDNLPTTPTTTPPSQNEKAKVWEWLINTINAPMILRLKKGTSVMCVANIDMANSICNGSIGIVRDIFPTSVLVQFTGGVLKNVEAHTWTSPDTPSIGVSQIPLCQAWAMTIHKIQGSTLPMAEMDIGKSIFEYGQSYVALSRIQSLEGLYLTDFSPHVIKAHPKVVEFYNRSFPSSGSLG